MAEPPESDPVAEVDEVAELVRSACSSDLGPARSLLASDPDLARQDLAAACACGEADEVDRRIAEDPETAHRRIPPLDWEPLLYATFSRFLRDPDRTDGIVAVVESLLRGGADPNVWWADGDFRQLPVFGAAGIANHAGLTELLLNAGADPNETYDDPECIGEALYHAAEFSDPTCARLLIEAGTLPNRVSYCLGRALDFPNPAMVDVFLTHGAAPTGAHLRKAVYFGRPANTVRALLDAGAPVDDPDEEGLTALRLAVRRGHEDLADLLTQFGADASSITAADRRWGDVVRGAGGLFGPNDERPPAELLEWAAHLGDAAVVGRLLDAGAQADGYGGSDRRPIGQAAWRGHAEVVRQLADHGAALRWPDGSAIGAALHGAVHCHHPEGGPSMRTDEEVGHGDYPGVLRILLDAGAPVPERLWDPALDVDELLARFGASDD